MLLRFNGSEVGSKCFGFGLFTVTLQTHQPPRVHLAKHQRMPPVVAGEKDSAHSTLDTRLRLDFISIRSRPHFLANKLSETGSKNSSETSKAPLEMKTALLATFAAAALAFDGSGSVSSDADLDAYLQGLTGAGVDTGAGQPGNKWPGGHLYVRVHKHFILNQSICTVAQG